MAVPVKGEGIGGYNDRTGLIPQNFRSQNGRGLANIYLDALDKELERRGLNFCR